MSEETSGLGMAPGAVTPQRRVGVLAVLVGLAMVGIVMLFAAAMTRPVTYDEDQYIAAGVMARTLLPYRDFVYLQPPLYPFVLAGLFKVTGGWFVLTGRVFTFALSVVSGAVLWGLLRRLGAGVLLGSVLMAACLASPFLLSPLANTRNDALPLTLMLAGLLVHLRSVDRSWWGQVAAALLFGLAVEAKLTYLFGPVALGVHALFDRRRVAPYVVGSVVAAGPAVACFIVAPEGFRFGLLSFHLAAPADWYARNGLSEALQPIPQFEAVLDWLTLGGNLTLTVLAVVLSLLTIARKRKWKRPGRLLLGLTLGAFGLALVPSPSWPMYFAPVAPLLACCIAHLDRITTHLATPERKTILAVVAGLASVPILLANGPEIVGLWKPGGWVGVAAHRTALEIHAAVPEGDVATLFPLEVLDANVVRPAFSTGPFVFRSGHLYSAGQLERLHALSAATLGAAFDAAPPGAILAGLYPGAFRTPMDRALVEYAEQHGWPLVRTGADGGRLWRRP